MASIVDFDAQALTKYLSELGIQKTWLSMLKTHLADRADLKYVFSSARFQDAIRLDKDLIHDLSIGEISVLYEYSLATVDSTSRKDNGMFFTPDDVAQFMCSFSNRFPQGQWLDPCAGIGNLSWHLVSIQQDPEKFLMSKMILSDRDDLALLIARTLLTASFQKNEPRLFHKIRKNFVTLDFLSMSDEATLFGHKNSLDDVPAHDFVIVNPPYLATTQDDSFETATARDLYAYFLENIIKTSSGFISITPQSFTNASKFFCLRRLLLERFRNITVFCFDNIPGNIFRGIKFGSTNSNSAISIRPAITIAIPGEGTPRITSLLRWRTSERSQIFERAEDFSSTAPLTTDFFPKVSSVFADLYEESQNWRTLASMVSMKTTDFPLFVPSSPRYFISATKSEMDRSSQHTLFFADEHSRNRAYLILNSSLTYWWWRVRDGGMTLSQETLLSVPLPKFRFRSSLVKKLEDSEATNRVHKQNAGAPRENVKHPRALIDEINRAVLRQYASQLLLTHENSEFEQIHYLPTKNGRIRQGLLETH